MPLQSELKKKYGYSEDVKHCCSCRYILSANDEGNIICKKTNIIIEDEVEGCGNETLTHVCDEWKIRLKGMKE